MHEMHSNVGTLTLILLDVKRSLLPVHACRLRGMHVLQSFEVGVSLIKVIRKRNKIARLSALTYSENLRTDSG